MVEMECTVILLTDNLIFAQHLHKLFTTQEVIRYEIITVSKIVDLLPTILKKSVSAVLLDKSFYEKNSELFVSQINMRQLKIPVIVCSDTNLEEDDDLLFLANGAQDIILKDDLTSTYLSESIQKSIVRQKMINQVYVDTEIDDSDKKRFKQIIDYANFGMVVLNKEDIVQFTNKKARALFGYDDFNTSGFKFTHQIKNNNTLTLSYDSEHRVKVLETYIEYLPNDEWYKIIYVYDLTEQFKSKRDLQQTANIDTLTKLYNRHFFDKSIKRIFEKCKKNEALSFALCIIDCDNFKNVNDTYGHDVGDELLKVVSGIIVDTVRPTDIVARIGGDEFAIILDNIDSSIDTEMLCRRIIDSFENDLIILDQTISTSMSIGIAHFNTEYNSVEEIYKSADLALYTAKQKGKNQYAVFSGSPNTKKVFSVSFDERIKKAVEDDEFELSYQPIVSSDTNRLVGFEPLIRWNSEEAGLLHPHDFFMQALDCGTICDIDGWAIRHALQDLKKIRVKNKQNPQVSLNLNLSLQSICSEEILDRLISITDEEGIEHGDIVLELDFAEPGFKRIESKLFGAIEKFKNNGYKILIDNFGSLSCDNELICRIAPQFVELDSKLLKKLESSQYFNMVKRTVDFCHDLDVNIIAEGVQNEFEYESMKLVGADFMKGSYISEHFNF